MASDRVVVRLLGGLGNQLFQYAMGRAIADARGAELVLDTRFVKRKGHVSGLAIELFNFRGLFMGDSEYAQYPEWRWKLSRALRKVIRPCFGFFHECGFIHDKEVGQQASTVMLSGFWQSYKYFPSAAVLRQDLSLTTPFNHLQQTYAEAMHACNSVAMHVRRGDYVSNSKALEKHGICSENYYQRAVEVIKERVESPVFYVFSDDPDWVKANISIENAVFVSDEGFDQEVDLMLIASCKHQIIANSSFSWWGAYLNDNPTKIVIVPTPWFDDQSLSDEDMSPDNWIKLAK